VNGRCSQITPASSCCFPRIFSFLPPANADDTTEVVDAEVFLPFGSSFDKLGYNIPVSGASVS
jgi:hypothetical protein